MGPEHVLKPLQALLRLLASHESRFFLFIRQLVEMLFEIPCLDEKEAENGMAAIGAVWFTLDAGAVLLLHFLESCLCFVYQQFVASEKIVRFLHDYSKRIYRFYPPPCPPPQGGRVGVGVTPLYLSRSS